MRLRYKTLSRQLLIQVMSYTLLLSIPVAVVNVWINYRQEAARQQEQVEAVRSLFGLQLAKAVWDFDQTSAQQILSHLDQFPALQHVEVVSSDFRASYIKKGLKPAPSIEVQRYPLMAPDDNMEIGQLQLSLDAAALRGRVWRDVVRIVAMLGAEMMLFAVLIFALIQRSVTLPVLDLSQHVRNMTLDRLDEPAPLPRAKGLNELHELSWGVTRLQRELNEQLAHRDTISRSLKMSETRLQLIADGTPNQLWTARPDGTLDYVSKSALSYFSLEPDQLLGDAWQAMVHPDDLPLCNAAWALSVRTGKTYQIDCRLRRFDGVFRWHALMAVSQRDEVGNIVKWFGSSTDIHDRKVAEYALVQHRIHLEQVVAERTAALSTAKEAAEAASRSKSTFLANMSHEIRTPLNAIIGFAQLMRVEGLTVQQTQRLEAIHGAGNHLLSVINDVLDLSKIEANKMALELVDFSIDQLLNSVASIVAQSARQKGLMLFVDAGSVPTWLRGDVTRLRQALLNYASNGVKFTHQGSITLRAKVLHRHANQLLVRFEVQDTGVGVASDKLPLLFQAFEQADPSITRQYGGTGLGLVIAKGIAQLMDGQVGADSTIGVGSTFWFTAKLQLGIGTAPSPSPLANPSTEGIAEQRLAQRSDIRILVAEDNALNRMVAEGMLQVFGIDIESVGDGSLALTRARERFYDLVFMDMQMPVMGGVDAARAIRALPGWADTPIVAMTANAFGEDRAACMEAGMNDFITKPIDMQALGTILAKWLPNKFVQ